MGYDLHITRADDASENADATITLDEWRDFVSSDSEFRMTGVAEATNPVTKETIRFQRAGITEWHGHSAGGIIWFSWFQGNITVTNPDEEVIRKMQQVAARLQARVQGDEGEWYNTDPE